jgi:long-chain acyl-CoA synthetase
MGITRPIAEHARRLPGDTAFLFEGRKTTRRDLDQTIARLAAFIVARTPRDGAVALDLPNGPALAVLFLAAAAAGRDAQILDSDWPADTARSIVASLNPALVVTTRAGIHDKALIVLGEPAAEEVADMLGAPSEFRRVSEPDPELIFYTGFTSGSTGLPKGFRRTHRSWLASFAGAQEEFGIGPADCVFAPGPLSHSMPLYALASALHSGAKFALVRGFQAHSALRAITSYRVTVFYTVPAQLVLTIEAAEAEGAVCHGVRLILCSGSKWPIKLTPRMKKVFPNALFAEFYGASELSFITLARSDERVPKTSVGRAFPGVTVSIRSPGGKKAVTGRTGLVFVESALVFSGYAGGESEIIRAGEAMSVGDRGFLDKSGFLHLAGRTDRLVISSGRNIQPEEVEAVLDRHPAILASAVFGVEDDKRGERLVAMVQLKPGKSPAVSDLVQHLRKVLPAYKVPARFARIEEWPATRLGKTDFAKIARVWADEACEALE